VLVHYERGFKRVKGYAGTKQVMPAIKAGQVEDRKVMPAA